MAWHAGEGMGWWMLFGGLPSIAFWATIIYLVVALVRGGRARPADDDPIDILKRRYARGGLSRDEYEQARRDLAA
jgi:putative membrane protein